MKITELLQINEMKNEFGEVIYSSFGTWKKAAKTANPDVWFDGDADICNAMVGPKPYKRLETRAIGEWDGEQGVVFKSSVNEQQDVAEGSSSFKAGDSVTIENAKKYDSMAPAGAVSGVVDFVWPDGRIAVTVKNGASTGQMNVDAADLVQEGVGGNYAEQLAQQVFDHNPNLDTSGSADELMKAAYSIAKKELGARAEGFFRDEDFPSDFVSAYHELQQQGVAEDSSAQDELKTINDQIKAAYKEYKSNHQMHPNVYAEKVKKLKARREELIKQLQHGMAEGLSKRDQQDVDAIKAAIERLQAQLQQPNADRAAIQAGIAHEKKRLALYGQDMAEAAQELGLDPDKRVVIKGVRGMKSTPFTKKFKNLAAYEAWLDSDEAGDYEIYEVMNESTVQQEAAYADDLDSDKPIIVKGFRGMQSRPFKKRFKNMAAFEYWLEYDGDDVQSDSLEVTNESTLQQEAFDTPEFASHHEEAMFHLSQANDASAGGDRDAYHMHMLGYHESMADHAADKGNSAAVDYHTERAGHHASEAPVAVEPTDAEEVAAVKENKKELQLPILVSAAAKFTLMYHEANFILRSNGKRLAKMAAQSWQHMLDAVKNRTSATTEEGYSISLNGDSYAIADSAGNVLAQLTAADMDKLATDSNIFLDTLSAAQ